MVCLQKVLPLMSEAVILVSHMDLYCVPWLACKAKFNIFIHRHTKCVGLYSFCLSTCYRFLFPYSGLTLAHNLL